MKKRRVRKCKFKLFVQFFKLRCCICSWNLRLTRTPFNTCCLPVVVDNLLLAANRSALDEVSDTLFDLLPAADDPWWWFSFKVAITRFFSVATSP